MIHNLTFALAGDEQPDAEGLVVSIEQGLPETYFEPEQGDEWRIATMTPTTLADLVIAALPNQITLGFVQYDDKLTDEDIQKCLDGEQLEVENGLADDWLDDRARHEREYIVDALKKIGLEDAHEDTLNESMKEAVTDVLWARDDFDVLAELLAHTGRRMFRLALSDPADPDDYLRTDVAEWSCTDEELDADANRIADALGITDHGQHLREIMRESCDMGSQVFLLFYAEPAPIIEAIAGQVFNNEAHTITFPAGSAHVLVFGRGNGSGYVADDGIPGEITLPLTVDMIDLDHKAGPGYSYSDDVAGLVYSCFEADPTITKTEAP